MGKVLVTGATGKVGREVVAALAAADVAVRAGTRHPESAAALGQERGVEVVYVNVDDPAAIADAFAGVDRLFLVTPEDDEVARGRRIVDAARRAGVARIVKLSAIGVERDESSGHRIVERYIEESDIPYTHLRPNWFMQNFSTFMAADIQARGAIFVPAGRGKTSFVDTRDIAAVALRALTADGHAGKAYTLTGGVALDHAAVAAILARAAGRAIAYPDPSPDEWRAAMAGAGMSPAAVDGMVDLYGMIRAGMTASVSPDVETVLGRAPIAFERFADDYADAWR